MTVKDLIAKLNKYDPETEVALSVYGHNTLSSTGFVTSLGEYSGSLYSPASGHCKPFTRRVVILMPSGDWYFLKHIARQVEPEQ